jgi:hypothetical protein
VPGCDDPKNPRFDEPWVPDVIPPAGDASKASNGSDNWSNCKTYGYVADGVSQSPGYCKLVSVDKGTTIGCSKRVFDDDMWTVVNQWDLACDEGSWLIPLSQSVYFVGVLVGSFVFGFLSDMFGRKPVFGVSLG